MGVPTLTFVQAIGTSLFLETSGFGSGAVGYTRRRLVDYGFARLLLAVALPAGAAGAVLARHSPTTLLRALYGLLMFAVAYLLWTHRPVARVRRGERERTVVSREGREYRYEPHGHGVTLALTGAGGTLAGLISTGIGEVTLPNLVRRVGMPVPVAAATSVIVVAATVVGAAATHFVQLVSEGGLDAIPSHRLGGARRDHRSPDRSRAPGPGARADVEPLLRLPLLRHRHRLPRDGCTAGGPTVTRHRTLPDSHQNG